MKQFSQINEPKDIITWDLTDFFISLQFYSAQELKDLEGMIYLCIAEVKAWNQAIIKDFFETFSAKFFSHDSEKDMDMLSRLVSVEHYLMELTDKLKIAKHYSYLKTPDCFKENGIVH